MTVFALPDLGEGLREAEIVAWHVAEGARVIADQPLVSVETDKAVVEIPAPASGVVLRLIAQVGDIVPVGGPLAEIGAGTGEDRGAIVGDLARAEGEAPPARAVEGDAPPVRLSPRPAAAPAPAPRVRASPAARRLARERGVDLASITGAGPGGAIQASDVAAAAAGDAAVAGEELRGVRRAMARAMARSHASVAPATVTDLADIGAWPAEERPTPRLIRAIAAACAREPALNAAFDGVRRALHDHVHLAVAVDTDDGLFAPVLRHVESAEALDRRLAELKAAVEARALPPEAFRGATITLSNFGMIGGEHAALAVSPPQVAIVGAGRIAPRCLVVGGAPAARRTLPLSLTFDHRAVTGGEAARFLSALREELEKPTATEARQRR